MTVYIYHGHGASQANAEILTFMFSMALHAHGIPVKKITQDDLNNPHSPWMRDASLLVFGGGEFTKVKEKLNERGRQAVKDFAAHKSYLGICKGAYAGAAQIDFLGKDGHKSSDGFGFFNGVARGSLPHTPSLYTGKSDSAQVMTFYHEARGISFPALYWGGPYFQSVAAHNMTPLITLQNPATDQKLTMGVKVPVGDTGGQAVLLGYHSEATPFHIRRWVLQFSESKDDIARIEREMSQHDPWKFYIGFACLLDDIGIVANHSFLQQILKPRKDRTRSPATDTAFEPGKFLLQ